MQAERAHAWFDQVMLTPRWRSLTSEFSLAGLQRPDDRCAAQVIPERVDRQHATTQAALLHPDLIEFLDEDIGELNRITMVL
jgi:hypothetical protein